MTDALIQFFDAGGALVYHLEGFAQRYVSLPTCLARTLMGTHDLPRFVSTSRSNGRVIERVIDGLPHGVLNDSFGIWRRALAPQALSARELTRWYEEQDQESAWLLERIAAKEAVREWMARHRDLHVPSTDVVLAEHRPAELSARCADCEATIPVQITHQGECVVARIQEPGVSVQYWKKG